MVNHVSVSTTAKMARMRNVASPVNPGEEEGAVSEIPWRENRALVAGSSGLPSSFFQPVHHQHSAAMLEKKVTTKSMAPIRNRIR
jgi:hypothetical protein